MRGGYGNPLRHNFCCNKTCGPMEHVKYPSATFEFPSTRLLNTGAINGWATGPTASVVDNYGCVMGIRASRILYNPSWHLLWNVQKKFWKTGNISLKSSPWIPPGNGHTANRGATVTKKSGGTFAAVATRPPAWKSTWSRPRPSRRPF